MKHAVKNMYTEMILDTIINGRWNLSSRSDYGVFYDTEIYTFKSDRVKVGKFEYKLAFQTNGFLFKVVEVYVYTNNSIYSEQTDEIYYSIFSPVYWRLRQMRIDRKNSKKIAETNLYIDAYKEFKKTVVQRDIAKIEQSLANLSNAEAEQRKMLEELRAKGEIPYG
jgi:hypothetical protein